MIIDLNELKEGIKQKQEEQLRKLAIDIVKYQKFKTTSVIDKITPYCSENTRRLYFDSGISYIKNKTKLSQISQKLYDYIDEALANCIQPLTPSANDERRTLVLKKKYQKKDAILPVAQLDYISKPLIAKFEYGIKLSDDDIKIFKTKDEAIGFLKGLKFLNNNKEYKLITVEINDIEEQICV